MPDPTSGNITSYFAAGNDPTDRRAELAELEALRQKLLGRPQGNVIIPATGAAKYFYVDPRVYQPQPNAVLPDTGQQPEGIGLLPPGTPIMLKRAILGKAPRLADDRRDLLKETEDIYYGGGHAPAPTPTPTPVTRMMPISYFT